MDLTNLLPSRSNAPVETQDAAASTSAMPVTDTPTIAAPKSNAQRQREYRQRIAASRTPAQPIATKISDTEKKTNYRVRKAANLSFASGSLESTISSFSCSAGRSKDIQNSTQRQLTSQQRQSLAVEPEQTVIQRGTSSDQIEVPDGLMGVMDLLVPSRSSAPVALPFTEAPTIAAPKSSAQRQREYRQRIAASRTPAQSIATRISETERKRNYRLRKAAKLSLGSGSLETIISSSFSSEGRSNDVQNSTQRQLTSQQRQSLPVEPAQTAVQLGTSSDQIEVPDEPMGLMDLLVPSMSNAPVETQDAAALTSAMTVTETPTIAAPKSNAQRQREYRQRIAASRTPAQSVATRISETERKRNYRLRKAANMLLASGSLELTTGSSSRSVGRLNDVQNSTQRQITDQPRQSLAVAPAQSTVESDTSSDQIEVQQGQSTWSTKWKSLIKRFTSTFLDSDFGYSCSVCDRLRFNNNFKAITAAKPKVNCREEYELVCNTCTRSVRWCTWC